MKTRIAPLILLAFHWISHVPVANARDQRLDALVARAAEVSHTGKTPIVVMDLDETVVDSTDRRFIAFQSSAAALCRTPVSKDCNLAFRIRRSDLDRIPNPYDSAALFDRLGLTDVEFRKTWDEAMVHAYLSGSWLDLDDEIPGARSFISALGRAGAHIVFISSRYDATQRLGKIGRAHV